MKKCIIIILLLIILIFMVNNKVYAVRLENIYEIRPTTVCVLSRDTTNNIRAMQGVYFFNNYAVYAGYQSDTAKTVITLVDLNTCKILDKNNEKIMGHANDITYNSTEDKFYVTTGLSDNLVYGFKIINNKIVHDDTPITMSFRTAAFNYDKYTGKYYSYANGALFSFNTLSANSERKTLGNTPTYYDNFENGKTLLVTQGISSDSNNIYFARTISETTSANYNDSYVLVFNAKTGEYKYAMHFPSSYFNGHLEGITVEGNKLYLGINVHTTPKNQSFLIYDGINQIEKEYNSIIKKIELIKTDNDISIFEKEEFNYNKVKIQLTYNDNSKKIIDLNQNNSKLINFNNTKIGSQKIKIEYDNKEHELDITIKKIEETSRELIIKEPIEIIKGNNFDYTNLFILIKYNNGAKKEIKLDENNTQIINFDNQNLGNQKIKIKYDNKEYECDIFIKEIVKITIDIKKPKINDSIGNTKPSITIDNNEYFELYSSSFLETSPSNLTIDFSGYSDKYFKNNRKYYIEFSLKQKNPNIALDIDNIILKLNQKNINYELKQEIKDKERYYIFLVEFKLTNRKDYIILTIIGTVLLITHTILHYSIKKRKQN